jgi:branched-chain amino acid transport system substrate-binding protein
VKRAGIGAIVLASLIAACGSGESTTNEPGASDTSPIRIGVVGPMTGLAAFVGKNMVEGIQLAIDDINGDGGLLGRRVEFVIRDDEFDPAKTGTAVRELLDKEEVAALFGPASTTSYLSISRLIQDAKVPTWVIMAGPELTETVNPYAFRAFIPDTLEIDALAEYAAKRYQRIAIVTGTDAEGSSFAKATTAALRERGRTPVATATFAQDETDFSPLVLKVKQADADAVILGTHLGLFGSRFAVAKQNLGLDAQVLGPAGLINYTYPDLARDAADGTVFVSFNSWGHLPRDQWPTSVREFYEAYVKRYLPDGELSKTGAYKAYSTNFLTYDMVQIWAEAVRQAKSADAEQVSETLNGGFTYPAEKSVIGVPWEYSADDHDGIRPGDLAFYRWDLQADKKFKLDLLGSVTDVLSGKAGN